MNLLYITHNWSGEGTYVRALMLAREMARRGHTVALLGTSHNLFLPKRFNDQGVEVVLAPHFRDTHRGGWGWLDLPYRLIWSLNKSYDLVHAFDHKPNVVLPAWLFKQVKGVPLVSDWADWWGKGGINAGAGTLKADIEEIAEERVRRLAGWVTAISPALQQRAWGLGLPKERVIWLPGGADLRTLKPMPQAACRRAIGIKTRGPVGVFIGLGMADLPLLLQGFRELLERKPQARLLLLGPLPHMKMALARQAGCADACLAPGRVPEDQLNVWLGAADFGLIPLADNLANQARWPNKVGEYLAVGLPVITNPGGPLTQMLKQHGNGLLVEPSPRGFRDGMLKLAAHPALSRRMGAKSRKLAEKELSWEKLAGKLEKFYEKAVSPR